MFGFIADILTSITSILFPIFASYKALRTSDPANLAPWLMYWTTLSLFLMVESQLHFILSWLPFYAWIRLGAHLYLVLPGKQGSVYIYKEYIHPFLEEHERQIDHMISDAHARAKEAGLDAVKQGWEYVRTQILGQAPRQPSPQPSRNVSYATYLMDRFTMPSARQGLATAGTTDVFSLIGKAVQMTTYADSKTREEKAEDLASSGTLIPPGLSADERTDWISKNRSQIETLLRAFDLEAKDEGQPSYDRDAYSSSRSPMPRPPSSRKSYLAPDEGYMHKSRSESEFEDLAYEPSSTYEAMPDPDNYRPKPSSRASDGPAPESKWGNWIWGNYGEKDSALDPRKYR